jgi:hypothetical protein
VTPCLDDTIAPIEIDEIDGELHAEGVHSFARHNPEALTTSQSGPAQQAFPAALAAVCQLDSVSDFGLAS